MYQSTHYMFIDVTLYRNVSLFGTELSNIHVCKCTQKNSWFRCGVNDHSLQDQWCVYICGWAHPIYVKVSYV